MNERVIIIADHHPLFRRALCHAVLGMSRTWRITEAGDFRGIRKAAKDNRTAEILLLDLNMPDVSGFCSLLSLRLEFPRLPIVIVTAKDDPVTVRRSFELGASGFISKSEDIGQIRRSIQTVLEGGGSLSRIHEDAQDHDADIADLIQRLHTLTPQQSRVLTMLAEGMSNKQIAYNLSVLEATAKAHVSSILRKLNVGTRTQAVIQISKFDTMIAAA